MSLDFYLGECYRSDVLGVGNSRLSKETLKDKLCASDKMRKEAEERILQLEPVKERCFISGKHLGYLRECLTNKG
jgi:hypothetical protein